MNLVMFFNNAKKYGLFIFVLFLLATICFGFIWCFFRCFGVRGVYPLALLILLYFVYIFLVL